MRDHTVRLMSSVRAARVTVGEPTSRTTRNTLRASRTRPACRKKVFSEGMESGVDELKVGDGGVLDAMFIKDDGNGNGRPVKPAIYPISK